MILKKLNALHIERIIDESRQQKERLKTQYKKVDFLIRAQHEAEISLIYRQSEDEIHLRHEIQLAERERAIERRERLIRMENDKKEFFQSIRGQRHDDFILQMKEYEQRLKLIRQQRLEKLRKEHIEKKKQNFRKEKQLKKTTRNSNEIKT